MPRAAMSVATRTRAGPAAESGQRAVRCALDLVAVDGERGEPGFVELSTIAVGAVLGAREDRLCRTAGRP